MMICYCMIVQSVKLTCLMGYHNFVSRNVGLIEKIVILLLTCSNRPWTSNFTRGESARTKTYSPIKDFNVCYKSTKHCLYLCYFTS